MGCTCLELKYPSTMQTVTLTSAGGVIVDDAGKIVLTSRRSFKGILQLGLPKGLIEANEEPAQAALREAKEETGLEVEILQPLPTIEYWYVQPAQGETSARRVHKFVHYFLMRPVGGDPRLHDAETEDVLILDPDDALIRASYGSEKTVISAAMALRSAGQF